MSWWQRLWRRKQMEEQLDKELRFHLEQQEADLVAQGLDPSEARRQARLALGTEQVKEECRDARGTRWLEDLWHDFRYALRTLRLRPGFTAVALVTLALGIGATTVMFTVINGVLLKPLPYPHPDRLLDLWEQTEKATAWGNRWAFAYPNYLDLKREARSFDLAAWRYGGGIVSKQGEAEYVDAFQFSPDLMPVLGANLLRGRNFRSDEDHAGAGPVIIISYGLWQRFFGGSPQAIGSTISFDGKTYTIIGIAPAGFRFQDSAPEVITPLGQDNSPAMQRRDRHPGIRVLARLHAGVAKESAQTELAVFGRQLAQQFPASNEGRSFVADSLVPDVGDVRPTLLLLLGAVSLVLLIACVNVASLLLARAVSRRRELAMRVALGASRGRLIRQCLTESAVLGLCGGVLGLGLAVAGIQPFLAYWPGSLPRAEEVQFDGRVLLFVLLTSLVSGLVFGLAPALRAPKRDLEQILRAGARTVTGSSRRLHSGFVVSEIALAVVLLVSAGILGRTMLRLSTVEPGLDVHNVLVTRIALSPAALADPERIRAAWKDVLERARHVAGVESAAGVDTVPLREGNNQVPYWTSPALPPPNQQPLALATVVTPDYLKVMRIPLLKGRFFNDDDKKGHENVVVIDDVLAERAFHTQDAMGKLLWFPSSGSPFSSNGDAPDSARVIGVVGHVRYWGLAGDDQAKVRAQYYYPLAQVADPLMRRWSELMSICVRTGIPPLNVLQPLRQAVRSATGGASGEQALYEVRTMEQLAGESIARQRFLLLLFGIFAALALMLACIGIYGVLTYVTSQRVPEFGVRMALGASAGDVMRMVLRQSLGLIALGAGVGMAAAFGAGRLLQHLVDGVQSVEPQTLALMMALLVAAALAASFLPALRASRIDPMTALREE